MAVYYNKEVETMSIEEKKLLQGARLREVVKREYDNVPTYREKMDALGIA